MTLTHEEKQWWKNYEDEEIENWILCREDEELRELYEEFS